MKKNKRFFGLHFDFHASNTAKIGSRTDFEDIEWYINEAKPDFIQCDSKGHPGNCSYPTKLGNAADNLAGDNLRVWCDAAKKHGVPIYVHYSGVFNQRYAKEHPSEAALDKDGNVTDKISLFGNYVSELLIPQLKEMIDEYGIDGAWVDGECWAVRRDYSKKAKPYLSEGMTEREHNKIMRDAFLRYVRTYVDALHEYKPDFMITSNWMFSDYMPEKPSVNIDFMSGDFPHNNSIHAARFLARCVAAQNMSWDLMAWAFEQAHSVQKTAVQLSQEAASVLMLGGGFSLYITQNQDGSARRVKNSHLRKTSDFVHARRMLFEKKPIAQVGILFSEKSYYELSNIYMNEGASEPIIGALNAVLDAQYTAGIIMEYQTDALLNYDIVLVPEWENISDEMTNALVEYAKSGGNLVLVGASCCASFGKLLEKDFGEIYERRAFIFDEDGNFSGVSGTNDTFSTRARKCRVLDIKNGDERLYSNGDLRDEWLYAYRIDNCENGKVAFIPFDFGSDYFDGRTYIHINFIKKLLHSLSAPVVEINRKMIDITMQKQENGIFVNLLNMNQGRHSLEYLVYDEISPIYDIEVFVDGEYKKVEMLLGEEFSYEVLDGKTKIRLKKLDIHSVISLKQ